MHQCPFCQISGSQILLENEHFYAIRDIHPVTRGHCLIVSKRHAENFFALNQQEMTALHQISHDMRELLAAEYSPDGYNLGMNCGAAAGQSVFHFHLHFIPRYRRDGLARRGLREFVKDLSKA